MGTFGQNPGRNNWFWSIGAIDNQAWGPARAVGATGRITQLTAYMAGDVAACTGGPVLWDSAGNPLLYTASAIARGGRGPNSGQYVNAYGFSYLFTNPTTFYNGMFRNSGDSWVLGFDSTQSQGASRLKTVGGGSPGTSGGTGGTWVGESGYNGSIDAYATYVPLGLFARVAGVFVPVVMKHYIDTTTSYFAAVMADSPMHYFRAGETLDPSVDLGSLGIDGAAALAGPTARGVTSLITDPDKAVQFSGAGGLGVAHGMRGSGIDNDCGPVNLAIEFWTKALSSGWNWSGFGDVSASIGFSYVSSSYGGGPTIRIKNGTDVFWVVNSQPFGAPVGIGGLEEGDTGTAVGVMVVGTVHHVVVKYTCGSGFNGDGNPIAAGGALDIYVDGISVAHYTMGSYRPFIFSPAGQPDLQMQIGFDKQWFGGAAGNNCIMDEIAVYGNYTPGLDPLPPTRIAAHNSIGRGALGSIVASAGVAYVRDATNTWITVNEAIATQQLGDGVEIPCLVHLDDGTWTDGVLRQEIDNMQHFGTGWERRASGLLTRPRAYEVSQAA